MTNIQYPRHCECGKYFTGPKQYDDHKNGKFHEKYLKRMKNFHTYTTKMTVEDNIQSDIR